MTADEKRVIALIVGFLLYVVSMAGDPWFWWAMLIWDTVKLTFAWLADLIGSVPEIMF